MPVAGASPDDPQRQLRRLQREAKRLRYELSISTRQVPHLRYMIDSCPDGLALLDGEGTIVEHNTAMATLFGDASLLLIDTPLDAAIDRLRREREAGPVLTPSRLTEALTRPLTLLVELLHGVVEFRLSGWLEDDGRHYVIAARPIATHDTQARELLKARQRIQALDDALQVQSQADEAARLDALSMLASTMVHDLNNALAVVLSNIYMLREEVGPGVPTELIDDACTGTARVQELVNRLRSFSTGPSLVLRQLCVTSWLPEFLRPVVSGHRGTLKLDLPSEKVWISADENQLAQVILNLVTNAAQAATGAGRSPVIRVRMEAAPHGHIVGRAVRPATSPGSPHAVITIEDNGPGVPTEGFRRLFTPFVTTKAEGSGLGLASVARITALHRGGIAVDNREEGGARFTLAFPIAPACSSHVDAPLPPTADPLPQRSLTGSIVVIMDDDPRVRKGLRRILEGAGAVTTETANGEEFLESYARHRRAGTHPVAILDILVSGGMGGLETVSRLRRDWPDAVAMACTGHAELVSTDELADLGFHRWILKPFEPDVLLGMVGELATMARLPPVSRG